MVNNQYGIFQKQGYLLIILLVVLISCNKEENKEMRMNITADRQEKIFVGNNIVIDSASGKHSTYNVVFEDDGETGYFYAMDMNYEMPIQEALHIYNVKNVADKEKASEILIAWSQDGYKSILFINNYPHAVIDFKEKRGYCRTGFPPRDKRSEWSISGHDWDEEDYKKIISK